MWLVCLAPRITGYHHSQWCVSSQFHRQTPLSWSQSLMWASLIYKVNKNAFRELLGPAGLIHEIKISKFGTTRSHLARVKWQVGYGNVRQLGSGTTRRGLI